MLMLIMKCNGNQATLTRNIVSDRVKYYAAKQLRRNCAILNECSTNTFCSRLPQLEDSKTFQKLILSAESIMFIFSINHKFTKPIDMVNKNN